MDTDELPPTIDQEYDSDVEEQSERRHRRDFVGTSLERPKKNSRQRNRKRQRSGLDLPEESNIGEPNSIMDQDLGQRA